MSEAGSRCDVATALGHGEVKEAGLTDPTRSSCEPACGWPMDKPQLLLPDAFSDMVQQATEEESGDFSCHTALSPSEATADLCSSSASMHRDFEPRSGGKMTLNHFEWGM